MKNRLPNKILSMVLAILMLVSLVPVMAAAAAGEIGVTLSYRDTSGFLMARHSMQVKPGQSEEYGYVDAFYGTAVTAMDALVAAHVRRYGENPSAIAQNLTANGGYVSNIFGDNHGAYVFMVNGEIASTGAESSKLQDGDVVEFFAVQDLYLWMDASAWFELGGVKAGEIAVGTGESFTLSLKGIESMGWGSFINIVGAQVEEVRYDGVPFGGADKDRVLGMTGAVGEIMIGFDEPGIHYVSAFNLSGAAPFLSPWLIVTVADGGGPAAVISNGYVNPPPAPYIPQPPSVDPQTALSTTLRYIADTFVPAPMVGDEWAVMTLARADYGVSEWYYEGYFETVKEALKKSGSGRLDSATDNARLILALTAIGVDASCIVIDGGSYDLVSPLLDYDFVKDSGLSGAVFALLALDAKPYEAGDTAIRDEYIRYILDQEYADGGFGWSPDSFYPDMTGMVLQALAPYKNMPEVTVAIARALEALHSTQEDDGGYASWGAVSVENNAQVIVAAAALGHDPTQSEWFVKTGDPVASTLGYFAEGGGFISSWSGMIDSTSSCQGAYALIAYSRYASMRNPLYSMGDCAIALKPMVGVNRDVLGALILDVKSRTAASYTVASWNAMSVTLAAAEDVFEDADATQTMVNNAASKLNNAINRLWLVGQDGDDDGPFIVTITLQGLNLDSLHEETWIYRLSVSGFEHGSTVADVVDKALGMSGYSQVGAQQGYVRSVTKPDGSVLAEFLVIDQVEYTFSGWLYKVNGTLIIAGMDNYLVESGDYIFLYFTKNFKEDPDASIFSGEDFYASQDGTKIVSSAVSAAATVSGRTAVATVSASKITEALKDTLDKLKDANDSGAVAEVKVNVTGIAGATAVKTEFKAESIKGIAAANDGKARLTIESGIATLAVDAKALAGLIQGVADGATVEFLTEAVEVSTLDTDAQKIVGDSPVFNLAVTADGKEVHDLGGMVTVTLPFDPPAGADPATMTVYRIGGDGNPIPMENVRYDAERREFVFTTAHFSLFFIAAAVEADKSEGDKGWDSPFTDVRAGDWFYDVVNYVYDNHLMVGTSASQFSPHMLLSRAMLLTVLHRLAGAPAVAGAGSSGRIPEGMWFTDALLWADENDILTNAGSSLLDQPEDVTREELATILFNFQRYADKTPMDILADRSFADWNEISDWAKNAVNRLTIQGLLSGKPGNLFDPKGNATRAEFAAILARYLLNLERK
ncbi:MAG: S-layer homology domain-containing protein [Peptococcaceae bacterium]|nr:S-layer homology domain-containing protein [Peptococcaceae bacterium]